MYNQDRYFSNASNMQFCLGEKLALFLVIFSLGFVVLGGILACLSAFSDTELDVWGLSAVILLFCAAFGFCRLWPCERSTGTIGQVSLNSVPDDLVSDRMISALHGQKE